MIGKVVSHYQIISKLGSGGMGVVYKAEDIRLKRTVALKFLPSEFSFDEDAKVRFMHEAQAASSLQHNNICNIHEIDETKDGQLFICMDYYEGESLKQKIDKEPRKIETAVRIITQIAEGLKKAHEKNIIHRDIKPANIFITNDDIVKILDFGLAKITGRSQLTKLGSTVGTVAYMSPEQVRGDKVDHRTDIWSLGVVLYEMITGQEPFKGEYEQAISYSIINEEPEPLTDENKKLPKQLEWIIKKALEKNPDDRYQTMDEMLSDLKSLITQDKSETAIKLPKTIKKKRIKRIVFAAGLLILILIGFLLLKPIFVEGSFAGEFINIAVISAENQTGDVSYDYLQKAIPNLLITNLEQSKFLRVLTWERIHDLLKQIGKGDLKFIDRETGFQLCRMDKIDAIVIPSYMKAGNMFVTDVKVLDVNNKELLKSASANPSEIEDIFKQIDYLSEEISEGVGLSANEIESIQLRIAQVTTNSLEAYKYFLQGRDLYEKCDWFEARKSLNKAIELDSTFAMAYSYIAKASKLIGDSHSEKEAWGKAFKYVKNATEKEKLIIEIHHLLFYGDNEMDAIKKMKELIKKYPKEKQAYYELAFYYDSRMMYSEAINGYKKVLELDPYWGFIYNSLGYVYANMSNFDEAINYLQKYAALEPDIANPMDSMGDVYLMAGKISKAIEKYVSAIEINPDFNTDWKLSYAYALNEEYIKAIRVLEKFIRKTSSPITKAQGHIWKSVICFLVGRINDSKYELEKASELYRQINNPEGNAFVNIIRGYISLDSGDLINSQKSIDSWYAYLNSTSDVGNNSIILFNYFNGLIELRSGEIDSAKSRYKKVKSLVDGTIFYWKEISKRLVSELYCELLIGQDSTEEAINISGTISKESLPYVFTNLMIIYNISFSKDLPARIYYQNGNLDKAIAVYKNILDINRIREDLRFIYPKYHYRLAKLYEETGLTGEALKEYKKFLEIWKNADKNLPEYKDAQVRLVSLTD
jgi:serine/threonine protein kinase/Flp pilus assembly protein TadD